MATHPSKALLRINHLLAETDAVYHQMFSRMGLADSTMHILYTLLNDGGQHHVVDAAQQKLWNASVSARQDRDSDARPFNKHDLGDANRHFCDGMERIWLYPDGAVRGGTRRFQFSL